MEHFSNASSLICFADAGITIGFNDEQSRNAVAPIFFSVEPSLKWMDSSEHLSNAALSISTTDAGMMIDFNNERAWKA